MKKLLLIGLLGLAGCATTPKQPLPEQGYTYLPLMLVASHRCAEAGMITPALAAFGNTYLRQQAGAWEVDMIRWNERLNHLQSLPAPTQQNCNSLATTLEGYRLQTDQQEKTAQQQREDIQTLRNQMPKPPVTTFCNRIGDQVFCNSY